MMTLIINGQKKNFTAPLNLYDVLAQEGYVEMMIAVARNRNFVSRGNYLSTFLDDGDEIEIVAPMQGG
jgi:sulfur carrier protein